MKLFLFFCVILFALSTEVLALPKRQNGNNGFGGFGFGGGKDRGGNRGGGNNGGDFCKNSKLAPGDGTQNRQGSCVSTVLGEIPDVNHMTTTIITNPPNGGQVQKNQAFDIDMVINNLETGFFNDPQNAYYTLAQKLGASGNIQGHTHVVVQQIGGQQPGNPPDPTTFAFFLGVNDKADGSGKLTVNVPGLNQGDYRICTMSSSNSHQSVIMPVAQRGSQDDCIRIRVN